MTKALTAKVKEEAEQWGRKTYPELASIKYPHTYCVGKEGTPDAYQVEVVLLEKNDRYIHVAIAVSNGGLSSFFPKSESVIVYVNKDST
jgi:hypothetical protein